MDDFISYKNVDDHGNVMAGDFGLGPLKQELADEYFQRGETGKDRYYPGNLIRLLKKK
jgi:hypothetical protein